MIESTGLREHYTAEHAPLLGPPVTLHGQASRLAAVKLEQTSHHPVLSDETDLVENPDHDDGIHPTPAPPTSSLFKRNSEGYFTCPHCPYQQANPDGIVLNDYSSHSLSIPCTKT